MSFTDSNTGNGYLLPFDATTDEVGTAFIIRRFIARLQSMLPCQVTSVRTGGNGAIAAPGTVDVQLLVSQIDGASPPNATPRGTVTNVPWFRLASGQSAIIIDPQVNDLGFIIAADRDISTFKKTFKQAAPNTSRQYSYSDGYYVPMGMNVTPNQYIVFTSTGIRIVDSNGNMINMTSSGISITPAGGTLTVDGSIKATGDIVAGSISLMSHLHTGVTTGTSDTGPPVG